MEGERDKCMPYDPLIHHRKTLRLPDFDYSSPGAYHVTICTRNHGKFFDEPLYYQFAEETWKSLPLRFPTIQLDVYAILPDHMHCIIWLRPNETMKPNLSSVVGAYKSLVYKAYAQEKRKSESGPVETLWQVRYWERIVRNEKDLADTRKYILENRLKHALKNGQEYTS